MPANKSRKYQRIVNYIEDQVGADVNRDLLKVAIENDDLNGLDVVLTEISGQTQSAVDVADKIDQIEDALTSVGTDNLAVEQQTPIQLENSSGTNINPATEGTLSSTLSREIATWSAGTLTVTDDGAFNVAGTVDVQESTPLDVSATTVPTEQQTPVGIEDSQGTQIDPDPSPTYPDSTTAGHDLIGTGDLSVTVSPDKTQALLIAAHSDDANAFSVSATWEDGSGNIIRDQPKSEVLSSVTDDHARLVRKGPQVTVAFTDESGGSQNNINAYVGAHK